MALAVSTYNEDEPQASLKIRDDNPFCVYIHDAEGEQSVCMTMDQAVAMALWILKQNWEMPAWWGARINVLPPRRNGDPQGIETEDEARER